MDDERISFLGRPVSPAFQVRTTTIAPGGSLPYDSGAWRGALVVVELGEIEIECVLGRRRRFVRGDVLWLAGLPLLALHNPGAGPALLSAVSRSSQGSSQACREPGSGFYT